MEMSSGGVLAGDVICHNASDDVSKESWGLRR